MTTESLCESVNYLLAVKMCELLSAVRKCELNLLANFGLWCVLNTTASLVRMILRYLPQQPWRP